MGWMGWVGREGGVDGVGGEGSVRVEGGGVGQSEWRVGWVG